MECHKFDDELQNLLNDEPSGLSSWADGHRRECDRCDSAYRESLNLRTHARAAAEPRLDRRSETFLVKQIVDQAAPLSPQRRGFSLWPGLFGALRWDRVLLAGGLATALIAVVLRLAEPKVSGPDPLQADAEIHEMVEEHVMAMDSGIFQGTSQYAKFIKETEDK